MFGFFRNANENTEKNEVVAYSSDRLVEMVLDDTALAEIMCEYIPLQHYIDIGEAAVGDSQRLTALEEKAKAILATSGKKTYV